MTNAAETEPKPPEENAPSVSERGDPPGGQEPKGHTMQALKKLGTLHGAASKLLEDCATGNSGRLVMSECDCTTLNYLLFSCDEIIEESIAVLTKHGEPAPATVNLGDIRGRVNEIAAIVFGLAAVDTHYREQAIDESEVSEYFNGACGIVRSLQRAVSNLQKALGTPESPAEGGAS